MLEGLGFCHLSEELSFLELTLPPAMDSISVDNDVMKDKIRSYNILNTLYHEAQQQIDILNKEICKKDSIIADFKARLSKYERICINVEEKEPVVIGPSKSLLESLCKEICKLKQKRNEAEVKASRQAEISQQEIQRLRVQLREKERELERVRCQPDHEKDQEIQKIRAALEERDRAQATRTVLCNSLAQEADQLRGQLGTTVKVCQELLGRLEREKKGGSEVLQQQSREVCNDMITESSYKTGVNSLVSQLQDENRQLKQRVAYVEGLNSKWQKYDSSREEYVRGLCQRLKETGAYVVSKPVGAESGQRPGLGLVPALGAANTGLLHQEIARLNGLLDEKMKERERLGRDIEDIRRRDQERIQTLEQQVLIYTEDFKSERADRERAQEQIHDLKEEMSRLKQQLHTQGAGRESRDLVPMCRVHIGHRMSTRRQVESAEQMQRTSSEPPKRQGSHSAMSATALPGTVWTECQGLSELQCPRCLTTFNDRDAVEYLNHCEECAKL